MKNKNTIGDKTLPVTTHGTIPTILWQEPTDKSRCDISLSFYAEQRLRHVNGISTEKSIFFLLKVISGKEVLDRQLLSLPLVVLR